MKNTILTRALAFLKANLLIILLVMVAGNMFYFFKNEELSGNYYSGTIKIRSNSTYYDRLHYILGKITAEKPVGSEVIRKYHSYHNEDHYIFEINVISRDSSLIYKDGLAVIDLVQKDTMISNFFYKRLLDTERLKKQNQKAFDKVRDEAGNDAINEFMITTLMINEFNLGNNLINIRKEFLVHPFSNTDIILVKESLIEKYLKINLVFFVLGLFVAIALKEFGKTSDA